MLFGSRARGDNHDRSDIDLAVFGMPEINKSGFWSDIEDLPTLLKFDIVHLDHKTDKLLMDNIIKYGIIIYEKSDNFSHPPQTIKRNDVINIIPF